MPLHPSPPNILYSQYMTAPNHSINLTNEQKNLLINGWPLHAFDYPVEILPGLWLSGIAFDNDLPDWCHKNAFTHIINASGSYGRINYYRTHPNDYNIKYLELDIDDYSNYNLQPHLTHMYNFIYHAINFSKIITSNHEMSANTHAQLIPKKSKLTPIKLQTPFKLQSHNLTENLIEQTPLPIELNQENNKILIHCIWGQSRSVSCMIYFMMIYHQMKYNIALAFIRKLRPSACPNNGFENQLKLIDSSRQLQSHPKISEENSSKGPFTDNVVIKL